MHILDTDTLTLLLRGHSRLLARQHDVPPSNIAITIVTRIEVLQGRFDFLQKAPDGAELLRAQEFLNRTIEDLKQVQHVLLINNEAARRFDQLRQNKRVAKIGRNDLLIASIALAHQAPVVTRNVKHFRQVPGLQVENWVD